MSNPHRVRLRERVLGVIARRLGRLSPDRQLRLSGEPPVVVDGQTLDPGVQLLRALRRRRGGPSLVEPSYAEARARFHREMTAYAGPREPVASVRTRSIDTPIGPLRVRHYAPPSTDRRARPLLVFFHGGGFVIGDLETHDPACRLLCRHAETHVLAVDYRLAPEHPFPAALDDALAAFRWARENAASLGADPRAVVVGGDSAGANLATVVARLAVHEGAGLAAQLLIYPTVDTETPRRSERLFDEGFFLSVAERQAFASWYVAGTGVDGTDTRVSPGLATDHAGMPPALVVTAGFDILRDEGEAYADALRGAGVLVSQRREPGMVHGFLHLVGLAPAARRAVAEIARDWRAMLDSLVPPRSGGA